MQRRLLSVRGVRVQCLGAVTSPCIFSTTASTVPDVSPVMYQNMTGLSFKDCQRLFILFSFRESEETRCKSEGYLCCFSRKWQGRKEVEQNYLGSRSETLVGEEYKALHLGSQATNKMQDEAMSRYRQEMLGQEEGSSLQASCLISFNKWPIQMLTYPVL